MVDFMTLGKMILRRKKAVSPVIATILLIALTVTAAAIVYFVVVPLLQKKPELVITSPSHVTGNSSRIQFTIQNIGSGDASLTQSDISLYDVEGEIEYTVGGTNILEIVSPDPWDGEILSQNELQVTIGIDPNTPFETGNTYEIRVSGASAQTYTY
ncbi:MAG: type IV pilin [Candidatus Heimdallarchaeota archaeon]|nr:type IV pilin [Candidatus Heimdallarchaeota archaeon]